MMDDDFNTAGAIACLFETVNALNRYVDEHKLEGAGKNDKTAAASLRRGASVLREFAAVLGLFRQMAAQPSGANDELLGKLVELLIELRAEARGSKNFAAADRIRDGLVELGVTLEDRQGKTEWSIAR